MNIYIIVLSGIGKYGLQVKNKNIELYTSREWHINNCLYMVCLSTHKLYTQ